MSETRARLGCWRLERLPCTPFPEHCPPPCCGETDTNAPEHGVAWAASRGTEIPVPPGIASKLRPGYGGRRPGIYVGLQWISSWGPWSTSLPGNWLSKGAHEREGLEAGPTSHLPLFCLQTGQPSSRRSLN